jgi:uncharacterized protein (TIGR02231 family)
MKRSVLVFSILLFFSTLIHAIEKPVEIKAPIASVKIFLNSALITHVQKVKLKTGINKLAFFGLATNVNGRNMSLRNIGKGELLSLHLVRLSDTTTLQALPEDVLFMMRRSKDSVLILEKNIDKTTFEIEALEMEKRMLLMNEDIIPNGKQISLAELKLTTEYYRDRYKDISLELAAKTKELNQLKRGKVRLFKTVFGIENDVETNMNICVIIAEINNPDGEYSSDIELSYLAKESGWIPVYEVLSNGNKSLKINYRAKILNNTGIDWNNLNVTMSTADPMQYYTAPDLEPYFVSPYNHYEDEDGVENKKNTIKKPQSQVEEEEIFTPDKEITFTTAKRYNFKSGLIPSFVDITSYDLSPEYLYRCAPKKEEQVYTVARVKDWEKLNLIDGEASIYNNGVFLGKSYIRPSDLDECLELPLGVVDNIFVKHKLVSELSGKKFLSGRTEASFNYEIKIKNSSADKVLVEVIDQVPVSESSNVKTDVSEMTEGGEKDPPTGKIVWKVELNSTGEKILALKYSVSYPRGYRASSFYKKRAIRAKF